MSEVVSKYFLETEIRVINARNQELGIESDQDEKWLPFTLDLRDVAACKVTTDDEEHEQFGKTSVYMKNSDQYFEINVYYNKFVGLWTRLV